MAFQLQLTCWPSTIPSDGDCGNPWILKQVHSVYLVENYQREGLIQSTIRIINNVNGEAEWSTV